MKKTEVILDRATGETRLPSAWTYLAINLKRARLVALNLSLTLIDHRVLRYIESFATYGTSVQRSSIGKITNTEIAKALKLDPANVSRSLTKLTRLKIIVNVTVDGKTQRTFNSKYAWRGTLRARSLFTKIFGQSGEADVLPKDLGPSDEKRGRGRPRKSTDS